MDSPSILLTLNETSGQHGDSSNNNHPSTTVTVTTQGSAAADSGWNGVGGGDDFNGSSNYVSVADSDDFFPGAQADFTIMAVCEVDTIDATFRRIAGHQTSSDGWSLQIVTGEGFRFERLGASASDATRVNANPTAGQTYMVHAVCDVTATNTATLSIYVDGSLATSDVGLTIADMANPGAVLALGRRDYDATRYLDGRIYWFAFFRSALSSTRISAHYAARNIPFIPGVHVPLRVV